jgi:hypothetical protein
MKNCLLIVLSLLISCQLISPSNEIEVKNNSAVPVDSVILLINNFDIKIVNVKEYAVASKTYDPQKIALKHDVVLSYKIFKKKSLVSGDKFLNDLGYLPEKIGLVISEESEVKFIFH